MEFHLLSNGISSLDLTVCLQFSRSFTDLRTEIVCRSLSSLFQALILCLQSTLYTLLLKWKRCFPCQFSAVCRRSWLVYKNSWESECQKSTFLPGQKLNCWKIEFRWKCRSVDEEFLCLAKKRWSHFTKSRGWKYLRISSFFLKTFFCCAAAVSFESSEFNFLANV